VGKAANAPKNRISTTRPKGQWPSPSSYHPLLADAGAEAGWRAGKKAGRNTEYINNEAIAV
jgi:hypothetical protein